MARELDTINNLLKEHQTVDHYLDRFKENIEEQEIFIIQKLTEEQPFEIGQLAKRQQYLRQAITDFYEGSSDHDNREEQILPQLTGKLLSEALSIEHKQIRELLNGMKTALETGWIEKLNLEQVMSQRGDLIAKSRDIKETAAIVSNLIKAHVAKENTIFGMLRDILASKEHEEEVPEKPER